MIKNGDIINVDVQKRRIDVLVSDEEMEARKKSWTAPPYKANRGALYKVCGLKLLEGKMVDVTLYWSRYISIHIHEYYSLVLLFSVYTI